MRTYESRFYDIDFRTGNDFLDDIFQHTKVDHTGDFGLCELLESLKNVGNVVKQLNKQEPVFDFENTQLVEYMQEICTLLEYIPYRDSIDVTLPSWVYNEKFYAKEARYIIKHYRDIDLVKLFVFANDIFLKRNIYFDEYSLIRY